MRGFALPKGDETPKKCFGVATAQIRRIDLSESRGRSVRQQRIDGEHVVAHDAVAQRARAAGVVARHAADGGAARRRHIDRKPPARRLELPVQLIENDPRLDDAGPPLCIEFEHPVEVLREIDDQRTPDGLAGLRSAAAAG